MKLKFETLDVFTTARYQGNPLAIISVPFDLSPTLTQTQKQTIATEFNLSEIVFLHLPEPGTSPKSRKIDIFTSLAEVPFAGHPTIGTSTYLLKILNEDVNEVITKAGPIPIAVDEGTGNVNAEVPFDFHVHERTVGCNLNEGAKNPVASIVNGMAFIYVELPSLEALSSAKKLGNLNIETYDPSSLDEGWKNGLVGTMYFVAQGEDEFGRKKYRTRMFGSREDPGTGSASSGLGCLLSGRKGGAGTFRYAFEQGVEMGRRNEIEVGVQRGGKGIEKVLLSGTAAKVMEGVLEV